jgi:hypothetical protein
MEGKMKISKICLMAFIFLASVVVTNSARGIPLPVKVRAALAERSLASIERRSAKLLDRSKTYTHNGRLTIQKNPETLAAVSSSEVAKLSRDIASLVNHLSQLRDNPAIVKSLVQRLEKLQFPTLRVDIEVGSNIFGQQGFPPNTIDALKKWGQLGESYSILYQTSQALGIKMNKLITEWPRSPDPRVRVKRDPNLNTPGTEYVD